MSLPTLPSLKMIFSMCVSWVAAPQWRCVFCCFSFFAWKRLSPLVKLKFYCTETAWANKNRCTFYLSLCFSLLVSMKLRHFSKHFMPPLMEHSIQWTTTKIIRLFMRNVFKLTLEKLFEHIPLIVIFWRESRTHSNSEFKSWKTFELKTWFESERKEKRNILLLQWVIQNDIKRYFPSSHKHGSKVHSQVHSPTKQRENILVDLFSWKL